MQTPLRPTLENINNSGLCCIYDSNNYSHKKDPRLEILSTALDLHVLYFLATGMRVNYYILIELRQTIVLSELECCLECDQTRNKKTSLSLKAGRRAVARILWSKSPQNTPKPSEDFDHTHLFPTVQLYFL